MWRRISSSNSSFSSSIALENEAPTYQAFAVSSSPRSANSFRADESPALRSPFARPPFWAFIASFAIRSTVGSSPQNQGRNPGRKGRSRKLSRPSLSSSAAILGAAVDVSLNKSLRLSESILTRTKFDEFLPPITNLLLVQIVLRG